MLGGAGGQSEKRDLGALGAALAALLFAALHVFAVFRENINWDEFAILSRTATYLRTGVLQGGGRLGAAELLLAPVVDGCRNAVDTIVNARLLWLFWAFLGLVGLFELVRTLRRDRSWPALGAAWAVALLALTPAYLRWSLQVRTDQAAIALGLWSGVFLLRSLRRPMLIWMGAALAGAGFLFSQKVVYVAALCGLLTVASVTLMRDSFSRRRVLLLFLATSGALVLAVAVVEVYRRIGGSFSEMPAGMSWKDGLRVFDYYRETYGYTIYRGMLWVLGPHLALACGLLAATLQWRKQSSESRTRLLLSWLVLGLGAAVALFHAGAFPYFWMTLGLFPAIAAGLSLEEIFSTVPGRMRITAMLLVAAWLVFPALSFSVRLLRNTQATQRASLEFIERNFDRADSGFHAEGALACREDPNPFPILFRQSVMWTFHGPRGETASARFAQRFVDKPVRFIVVSGAFDAFPESLRRFWSAHYQPYFGPVHVLGARLRGSTGERRVMNVLAEGDYRFIAGRPRISGREDGTGRESGGFAIRLAGRDLRTGETLFLPVGSIEVELLSDLWDGMLILALDEPPRRLIDPFYSTGPTREMQGIWN